MKFLQTIVFLAAIGVLLFFANCKNGGGGDEMTEEEKKTQMLTSKDWTVSDASQVNVPDNSATTADQWVGFTVAVTNGAMNTSGHPTGAQVVWPSGSWDFNDDVTRITREDGVQMTINKLTDTEFDVTFTVEQGTELGDRVAALGGEYTFNLE